MDLGLIGFCNNDSARSPVTPYRLGVSEILTVADAKSRDGRQSCSSIHAMLSETVQAHSLCHRGMAPMRSASDLAQSTVVAQPRKATNLCSRDEDAQISQGP